MHTRNWDQRAMAIVRDIEHAIIPLDLECQGEFISLTNAIDMQLESRAPVPDVVRHLGDAVLTLAHARGLNRTTQRRLAKHVAALNDRLTATVAQRSVR